MSEHKNYLFSGHSTFVLRSNWLKRLYDETSKDSLIFSRPDALIRFGVGKNMVDAIKYWGTVTEVIENSPEKGVKPTEMADFIFGQGGIDPFVVTAWTRWWLHWKIVSSAAFTWQFTFMMMSSNEIQREQIVSDIISAVATQGYKVPSVDVVKRDITCLINSYTAPGFGHQENEETLLCPLSSLGLVQNNGDSYRLLSGERDDLPDSIFISAVAAALVAINRTTISFSELMWGRTGPGRLFRLTEDALLYRISKLEELTNGAAMYSDHGGVRAVLWQDVREFDANAFIRAHAKQEVGR